MPFASLKKFARRLFAPRPVSPIRTATRSSLGVESLEDRAVPASVWSWVGGTVDSAVPNQYDWSTASNWKKDGVAATVVNFQAGDAVEFDPAVATVSKVSYDNLPSLPNLASITFKGDGYVINGPNTIGVTKIALTGATGAQDAVNANVTFAGSGMISANAGTTLAINSPVVDNGGNTLTVNGAGYVNFNGTTTSNGPNGTVIVLGVMRGAGGLTVNQTTPTGTTYSLTMNDTANYQGVTTVTTGNVLLAANGANAVSNNLVIGTLNATSPPAGSPRAAQVTLGGDNEIPDTGTISIFANGELSTGNLTVGSSYRGYNDTIGSVFLKGGLIDTSDSGVAGATAGTLTLAGDVTTLASGSNSVIKGHIDLGSVAPDTNGHQYRNFNIERGDANFGLDVQAVISDSDANVTLNKQGYVAPSAQTAALAGFPGYVPTGPSGVMRLQGTNTYAGATLVTSGTLTINNSHALGSPGTPTGSSTVNGTTVLSGATLKLVNSDPTTPLAFDYSLTLNGSGDRNLGGDANLAGDSNLTSDHSQNLAYGGALQAAGTTDGTNFTTLQWNGNINLASTSTITVNDFIVLQITPPSGDSSKGVISGTGGLIKTGTGSLLLSQTNTYGGATEVADGMLKINRAGALGGTGTGTPTTPDTSAGTTVDYAGALVLQNNVTVNNETLTLAGTGGRYDFMNGNTTDPTQATQFMPALFGYGGSSTWNGAVILAPNLDQMTATQVATSHGATLTISGVISNSAQATAPTSNNFIVGKSNDSLPYAAYYNGTQVFDGTVLLTGSNTYADTTEARFGILAIANNNALGSPTNETSNAAINGGTTVKSGATLQLQASASGNISTDKFENVALNGTGFNGAASTSDGFVAGYGALQNFSGLNTWGGNVTLATSSSIGVTAGTVFGPTGFPSLITNSLTIGSEPNYGVISGLAASNLTKVDGGVLVLTGTDTYAGYTYVNDDGTLEIENADALGAITSGTTVASSATLELSTLPGGPNITYKAEPLTLKGGSTLENALGANTWQGLIMLSNAASTPVAVQVDGTSALDLRGAIGDLNALNQTTAGSLNKTGVGTLTFSSSGSYTYTGLTTVKAGTLSLANFSGGFANLAGPVTVNGNATLTGTANLNGAVTVKQNGMMSGTYSITGKLTNSGTILLGTPLTAGTISVTGDFYETSTGTLTIELAKPTDPTKPTIYSTLQISGSETVDNGATLKVVGLNGVAPVAGNSFKVITFGSKVGTGAYTLVNTIPGVTFSLPPDPLDVTLKV